MRFVHVAVPLPVPGPFTYAVPERLESPPLGAEVLVPFGPRRVNGWVVGHADSSERSEVKPLAEVLQRPPAFTEDQLALYHFVAGYWLAPLGEVIATATPAGASGRTRHVYLPTEAGIEALASGEPPVGPVGSVLREIVARPRLTKTTLQRRLHEEVPDVARALASAMQQGWVRGEDEQVEGVQDLERWARLAPSLGNPQEAAAAAGITPRAVRAREVLARLTEGPCPAGELDAVALRRLVQAGLAEVEQRERLGAWMASVPRRGPPPLNEAQRAAVEAVRGPGTWLLHGVTGAGKTEVYLAIAERALAGGLGTGGDSPPAESPEGCSAPGSGSSPQVLVLVPEIALTPQLLERFAARFGDRVAVLHSQLSGGERLREWRRIREGAADVVVGARSAVFAPFRRLGLVLVDEEHDDSYKQEEGVRYHARDLAVVRGMRAGCPVVLGSATPSLESWENARAGRYRLLQLLERATPRPVPRLRIVDMKAEPKVAGPDGRERAPLLSVPVREAVQEALEAGGKAILLYNRRGFATFVECPGCGQAQECPSCGIALTYHQQVSRLDCHYCGFHRSFQPSCSACGSFVEVLGQGTERVEQVVAETFPGVPVGRMDADTTAQKGSHARILEDFREGRTRLLVGTQIVAKGHDFPDVHVAAVLGVDHILGMPDFRAAERTFALVTQLIGRAGRGDTPGRVFLQTRHPEHPVFSTINDMGRFAEEENRIRRMLGYPPWSHLVLVRLEATERQVAQDAAMSLARLARAEAPARGGVDVLGPCPAPMVRLVGRWRYQVILRGRERGAFRPWVKAVLEGWRAPAGVRKIVDVDPRSVA
jgi:primosomal protein N' (replication factor Y)